MKKRVCLIMMVLIMLIGCFAGTASAGTDYDYVTGNSSWRLPIPKCYEVKKVVNNLTPLEGVKQTVFKNPQDIFIDDYDNIYIVDTGLNRVVKMNSSFETVAVYTNDGNPEKATNFKAPQGVFVDADGDLYVADTGNARIVHLAPDGALVEIFTNPESDLVGENSFTPTKLVVSDNGYMYVVRGETIMAIDGNNEFRGLFGQTNIGYSLTEVLARIFLSEQQQLGQKKRLASSYINVELDEEGNIYATSYEREEGEIKVLNSIGNNIYRKYKTVGNSLVNPFTALKNKLFKSAVASNSFKFGEYFDEDNGYIEPIFNDICVDEDGIVTVVEDYTGKIYQYDQEGNMLVAFGGKGTRTGEFSKANSIAVDSKGDIYVVDGLNNNITVFEPTEFINLVHAATTAYNEGNYDGSYDIWMQVLEIHENYELAHAGIAKAYYKQGLFKEAMNESKQVGNRDIYTQAFEDMKYEILRNNFLLIVLIVIVIVVLVLLFFKYSMRAAKKAHWDYIDNKGKKMSIWNGIKYYYNCLFHPIDTMEGVRYNRDRINMFVPLIIMAAAYAVRIAYIYVVHYPLASIEVNDANAVLEAAKLFIVPITWIPASFAVTSISGGESKISQIYFTTMMGLFPYILINLPLMFASNIMSKQQASWYGVFQTIAYVWMAVIFFIALMVLNNYSFGKTIGSALITLFVMVVIWVVVLLAYVLSARVIQFVFELIREFKVTVL